VLGIESPRLAGQALLKQLELVISYLQTTTATTRILPRLRGVCFSTNIAVPRMSFITPFDMVEPLGSKCGGFALLGTDSTMGTVSNNPRRLTCVSNGI
jgi:hypothetical protein